eukprot:4009376-Amphidinium_carterae.1
MSTRVVSLADPSSLARSTLLLPRSLGDQKREQGTYSIEQNLHSNSRFRQLRIAINCLECSFRRATTPLRYSEVVVENNGYETVRIRWDNPLVPNQPFSLTP